MDAGSGDWKESVQLVFEYFCERTPRSFVEQRGTSLVWNYKYAGEAVGEVGTCVCMEGAPPSSVAFVCMGGGGGGGQGIRGHAGAGAQGRAACQGVCAARGAASKSRKRAGRAHPMGAIRPAVLP